MNMGVQISLGDPDFNFFFLNSVLRSEIAGSCSGSILIILRKFRTFFP